MVESKAPRSIEVGGTEAPAGTETLQATEALSVYNEVRHRGSGSVRHLGHTSWRGDRHHARMG